jgi:hypothetical protein
LVRLAVVLVWLAVVLGRLVRRVPGLPLPRAQVLRVRSLRLLVLRPLPAVKALRVTRVVLLVAML